MKKNSLLILIGLVFMTGCGTMIMETKSKLTNTIVLDKSKIQEKSIYIQVTNTANSSGEKMRLEDKIKEKLINKGYRIASTSDDSTLGLFINILFANNLREANAIKAAGATGGFTSVVAMGSGSNTGDSLLIGASAALAGAIIGESMEDETFRAVIDMKVKNYVDNTENDTRLFAQAVKMNLDLDKAIPVLEKESVNSIVNIF